MKKIALLTINGNENYGNKLQHFALQKKIQALSRNQIETIYCYCEQPIIHKIKHIINLFLKKRYRIFYKFDKKIIYSKSYIYKNKLHSKQKNKYSHYIVGSDQVWNVNFKTFTPKFLLEGIESKNKISYASSFGINSLPTSSMALFKNELKHFKYISVREEKAKEIVDNLTKRSDTEVLIDPTMLLNRDEWDKIAKKPKKLENNKYILSYFLGKQSNEHRQAIRKIAKKYNCKIINILDKNDPFYTCGPREFIYLEKHAFLICTDSFHSSVFAFLYDRPFVLFHREDKNENMESRLTTLIDKFQLENRWYNNSNITQKNLEHDYSKGYEVLKLERKKSDAFLRKALDIE